MKLKPKKLPAKTIDAFARRMNRIGLPGGVICEDCLHDVMFQGRVVWVKDNKDGMIDWAAIKVPQKFWERFK